VGAPGDAVRALGWYRQFHGIVLIVRECAVDVRVRNLELVSDLRRRDTAIDC